MPRPDSPRERPLSMRLPASDVAIIDRAAGLRGRSRTDFIREAAVRAAEEAIIETTLIRMSPAGFTAFIEALSAAPRVVPEMVELMERKAPWENRAEPSQE
jgi:uncharacterized protein (DUF1778 family)